MLTVPGQDGKSTVTDRYIPGKKTKTYMAYFRKVKRKINGKWYPQGVTVGKAVTTKEVANRLADLSALSPGDTLSMLGNLGKVLGEYMNAGRTVKLDGVGTFYYTPDTTGQGVDTAAEVTAKQIVGTRVRFIPEVSRSGTGQVNSRSLVSSDIFWEQLDVSSDTEEEDSDSGDTETM